MYALSPRALPMLCPLELQRYPVLPLLIAFRSHHPIHLFLVHLISCIQRPRPVVEVNLVVPRLGQYPCQVVNYNPSDRWPMGGETPRSSKYVRIFTHGVEGNEPPMLDPMMKVCSRSDKVRYRSSMNGFTSARMNFR
jgi:hypothetical protein